MSRTLSVSAVVAVVCCPIFLFAENLQPRVSSDSVVNFDIDGNRPRRGVAQSVLPNHGEPPAGPRGLPEWAPFGPAGADAESIAASPITPNLVIAGVSSSVGGGAIYRSTNSGGVWSLATGTGTRAVREVEFAVDGVAWAATDDGLFRSTDGGATWSPVALPVTGQAVVRGLAVNPTDPAIVWVGLGQLLNGTSPLLVFRTINGGSTWSDVSPPVTAGMGSTLLAIDPADPARVLAGFTPNFGGSAELWLTTDGGTNWAERSGGLPSVPFNAGAFGGSSIYVAGGQDFGSQFLGLYRSNDDGLTWTELSAAWPSRAANSVAIDPSDSLRILAGTTRAGLMLSSDGGTTWSSGVGGTGTYQINDIEFSPQTAATVYLGMGSIAVLRSDDGGATFVPASNGISRLEITSFAVNPLDNSEIAASYIGVNDGGIFISTNGGATWTLSQAPLPRWTKVYFAPNGTLYGTHNGPLGRAEDGLWQRQANGTWINLGPGVVGSLDNIGIDIAATPGPNPVIVVGGYRWLPMPRIAQIWTYNRAGPNAWELEYAGSIANEQVYSVALTNQGAGPTALAGVVNFGTGTGGILLSTDLGDTWSLSTSGYPTAWNAWKIEVAQTPETVYVAASPNTSQTPGAIIRSTDGGQTWTQAPATAVLRYIASDRDLPGVLYGMGPFTSSRPQISSDEGDAFQPYDAGYIALSGGRDIVFGGVVGGQRRLYLATGAGGWATVLPPVSADCPGDLDGDLVVDLGDLATLLANFGEAIATPAMGDTDGDLDVDLGDLATLLANFGTACR